MRVRVDFWWEGGRKRAIQLGAVPNPLDEPAERFSAEWLAFLQAPDNEARPGDVWVLRSPPGNGRVRSWAPREQTEGWPIVGYGLTCPEERCDAGVHLWDHASDCPARYDGVCKRGGPSCWTWTGQPEDDSLTGQPSLHIPAESGGCGWHGYLTAGQMTSVG